MNMADANVMNQFKLEGKVALVMGGSKGLGKSMALGFAQAGATTVISARTEADCEATALEISNETGQESIALAGDVTKEADVDRIFNAVNEKYGHLDVVVNSAGINVRHLIEDFPLDEFQKVMDINMTGVWLCCRAAARIMKAQGEGGAVVYTTSIAALIGAFGHPNYTTAKGGLFGFLRGTAPELRRYNIRANAIVPHAYSRMTAISEWMKNKQDVYTTDVIGQTVVFLASDLARDLSGRMIGAIGGKSGARVCELKLTLSDGHLMPADKVSAEDIGNNLNQGLCKCDIESFADPRLERLKIFKDKFIKGG